MMANVEEWLSALSALNAPSDDAKTVQQWHETLGKTRRFTEQWIREGLENGWMERAYLVMERLTGVQAKIVGFRLVKKGKR